MSNQLSAGGPCARSEALPEYSKDEFVRKAWIQVFRENAPLEVFDLDFEQVSEDEHQILMDQVSVDVLRFINVFAAYLACNQIHHRAGEIFHDFALLIIL